MDIKLLGRRFAPAVMVIGMVVATAPVTAAVAVYDFDGLADSASVTNQFVGLAFTNSTALRSGSALVNPGSLSELEFPPRSGDGVVFDDGGTISITFATPVFSVGAYFTYITGLSFSAYDSSNLLLRTRSSALLDNTVSSGNAPNEFLSLADAGGAIARILISGDVGGSSFVMDDLTVDNGNTVPEPQTLLLALALLGAGCLPRGWMRRRSAI